MTPLETRRLYKIKSRNLTTGVFNGAGVFLGIREKFGSRYVFGEFVSNELNSKYGDFGMFGTVDKAEATEHILPPEIPLGESLGTVDALTGRRIEFDNPVSEGGKGWYFKDTGQPCGEARPANLSNKALFNWLLERQ